MAVKKAKRFGADGKRLNPRTNSQQFLTTATLRDVRIAPRKARLTLQMVKGMQVEPALSVLKHSPRKSARLIEKLLNSAVSNAVTQHDADSDNLWVSGGWIDEGRTLKRFMPRAQGRATPIRKRSSHITVGLTERS